MADLTCLNMNVIDNAGYTVDNVFDNSQSIVLFHDSSGKLFRSKRPVIQCSLYIDECNVCSFGKTLDELCAGYNQAIHWRELPRRYKPPHSIDARIACDWLIWYLEEGFKIARLGIRVIPGSHKALIQAAGGKRFAFRIYNRQFVWGTLYQLACFYGKQNAVKLRIVADHDAAYQWGNLSKNSTKDNFPVYVLKAIAWKTCFERPGNAKYPQVLVDENMSIIARCDVPRSELGKYEWRILQMADLLAGCAGQLITGASKVETKRSLGTMFGAIMLNIRRFPNYVCIRKVDPAYALHKSVSGLPDYNGFDMRSLEVIEDDKLQAWIPIVGRKTYDIMLGLSTRSTHHGRGLH